MHLALRRYAEPATDAFHYFAAGAVSVVILLAGIAERFDQLEEREAIAAGVAQHHRRIATATATVQAYAYEAFPAWVQDHPDLACPAGAHELDHYVGTSGFDPWGTAYKVACERNRLVAWSFGPDGVFETDDDVRSR
jgi:hypothetical protein